MKSLIFDMDGTLFQTNRILEGALEDTFAELGALNLWNSATPIEEYRKLLGVSLPKVWEVLLLHHSHRIRESANEFFHYRLIQNIDAGNGALYPNVKELFIYLKEKGHTIFTASNGSKAHLAAIVKFYELDRIDGSRKSSAFNK